MTHLTKRFVKLLNSNQERVINLNDASQKLSVAKRRIYDITNVLEGIGLLQKTAKNVTKWIDCPSDSALAAPPSSNDTHHHHHNHHLLSNSNSTSPETTTTTTTTSLTLNGNSDNISPTGQDIKSATPGINLNGLPDAELLALLKTYQALDEGVNELLSNIDQQLSSDDAYVTYHDIKSSFNDQTVIAVKAPPETRLEVNEHLQIAIKSERGQIEVYLYQHPNNNTNSNNNNNNNITQNNPASQQPQLQNMYPTNTTSTHLQQSQPSNSTNTQPLDATFANTNNLISQQQMQPYTSVSSDEGRGRSTMSSTDVTYYDPTSGVSDNDHYYNDPTLSSALSGGISEDEDPFKPLVPFEGREEPLYNFVLDESYTIASIFPEDNLGLY